MNLQNSDSSDLLSQAKRYSFSIRYLLIVSKLEFLAPVFNYHRAYALVFVQCNMYCHLLSEQVDWAAKVIECLSHELTNTPFTPVTCSVQNFDKLVCKYAADAMYIPRLNLNVTGGKIYVKL